MPVTLQHIANAAKVSRTTVSLALRHHPKEWKKNVVVADLNCNQRGLPDRPKTVLIQADWKDGQTHRKRSNVKPVHPFKILIF